MNSLVGTSLPGSEKDGKNPRQNLEVQELIARLLQTRLEFSVPEQRLHSEDRSTAKQISLAALALVTTRPSLWCLDDVLDALSQLILACTQKCTYHMQSRLLIILCEHSLGTA
jgi:hypothetical protein